MCSLKKMCDFPLSIKRYTCTSIMNTPTHTTMKCYKCRRARPTTCFRRKGQTYKSCNCCSHKLSRKRKMDNVVPILLVYCPVRAVSEEIFNLAHEMAITQAKHASIKQDIQIRTHRSLGIARYLSGNKSLQASLLRMFAPELDPVNLQMVFVPKFRKHILAYARVKGMVTNPRGRGCGVIPIVAPTPDTHHDFPAFTRVMYDPIPFGVV